MKTEKLEFTTLDEFKQDLLNQDPTFADRLAVHKLQQAMIKTVETRPLSTKPVTTGYCRTHRH